MQLQEMMEGFLKDCAIDVNLTEKERGRLIGVKGKKLGFIEEAFDMAKYNPGLVPPYLDITLLDGKKRKMEELSMLKQALKQFELIASKAYLLISDECYLDALMFYNTLKEAAGRNVPQARSLYGALAPFFKHPKKKPAQDTETVQS
jgi:hypothetical protein